ncbi:hypothetical protein HZU67_06955 [Apis mellifera carnica]|nr:hypothetical protein HZU67_06955 [Apis mellifera carnica]
MYSSSDSDEQIVDRDKNSEASNCRKDTSCVTKSQKDESTIGDEKLDVESKSEENNLSNKDKDLDLGDTVQFNILDKGKEEITNYNEPDVQSNIAPTSAESDHENDKNQNAEDKCLDDSELKEDVRANENENSKNECADKINDKIELENETIGESEEKEG